MPRIIIALALLAALAGSALAVNPDERLADPALEARAREISRELRCLVCQNQSIDDSNAPLARDLRILVRERLVAGDTDEEVFAFVVERYGDFVRLRPPFRADTLVLWLAPLLVFLTGLGLALLFILRQRSAVASAPRLEPEEAARLAMLLEEEREP